MIIYQLYAKGEDCLGRLAIRYSQKVYTSRKAAENGESDFRERLERTSDYDMGYLEAVHGVDVIELELVLDGTCELVISAVRVDDNADD